MPLQAGGRGPVGLAATRMATPPPLWSQGVTWPDSVKRPGLPDVLADSYLVAAKSLSPPFQGQPVGDAPQISTHKQVYKFILQDTK